MTNFAFTVLTSYAPRSTYFGASTVIAEGGVDIGASGITIRAGDASGHWQILTVSGRSHLAPSTAGDTADLSGGPYSLIFSDGNRSTITIVAGRTVNSNTQLQTRLQAGTAAYGSIIYLRAGGASVGGGGDYTAAVTITPVLTGTWTAPSNFSTLTTDYSNYCKGFNLSTGTYVQVKPHVNEVVTIQNRIQHSPTAGNGRVRYSNLTLNVTDLGAISAQGSSGMLQFNGGAYWAVDNCIFQALDSYLYGEFERRVGVYAPSGSSVSVDYLAIQDCTFNDCWNGFVVDGAAIGASLMGNTVRRSWNDGTKPPYGNGLRYCWNFIVDKLRPSSGAHPDFAQWSGAGAVANPTNCWVVGNIHVRGVGVASNTDGQLLFIDDLGVNSASTVKWDTWVIMGNRGLGSYVNGIYFGARTDRVDQVCTVNSFVEFNTVLNDPTGVVAPPVNTYIRWNGGRQVSDTQKYNLANANGTVDDIDVSTASGYAAYDTYLAGGFAAMGAGVGSTLTQVVASTDVKTGSPADTASPKVGAHQAYFNYAARTISLPVTPPANP